MNQKYTYFLSCQQKKYFLVCHRSLVISLRVPWGWKITAVGKIPMSGIVGSSEKCMLTFIRNYTLVSTMPMPFFKNVFLFFKGIIYLFLEIGEGRVKEGERNIDVLEKHRSDISHTPPTGDLAHNPGMCPDWESHWAMLLRAPIPFCIPTSNVWEFKLLCYFTSPWYLQCCYFSHSSKCVVVSIYGLNIIF